MRKKIFDWRFVCCAAQAWYLHTNDGGPVSSVLQDVFSFVIIFNYIIPISLYVTLGKSPFISLLFVLSRCMQRRSSILFILEMQKFVGSLFFIWDDELRCPKTGEVPICSSSDLNEELGQV